MTAIEQKITEIIRNEYNREVINNSQSFINVYESYCKIKIGFDEINDKVNRITAIMNTIYKYIKEEKTKPLYDRALSDLYDNLLDICALSILTCAKIEKSENDYKYGGY